MGKMQEGQSTECKVHQHPLMTEIEAIANTKGWLIACRYAENTIMMVRLAREINDAIAAACPSTSQR